MEFRVTFFYCFVRDVVLSGATTTKTKDVLFAFRPTRKASELRPNPVVGNTSAAAETLRKNRVETPSSSSSSPSSSSEARRKPVGRGKRPSSETGQEMPVAGNPSSSSSESRGDSRVCHAPASGHEAPALLLFLPNREGELSIVDGGGNGK